MSSKSTNFNVPTAKHNAVLFKEDLQFKRIPPVLGTRWSAVHWNPVKVKERQAGCSVSNGIFLAVLRITLTFT